MYFLLILATSLHVVTTTTNDFLSLLVLLGPDFLPLHYCFKNLVIIFIDAYLKPWQHSTSPVFSAAVVITS